ncbi:hypothetical protein [Oleiagrimonas sp. C23AA]|uniref:hypothetical protein n=1 Tax=Oleiagrimonas sp. C23AA TaxID=2719047 RepID=UPI001F0E6F1E|nr:hypothetical protein [Oleiagrimonas sp. C23AA]
MRRAKQSLLNQAHEELSQLLAYWPSNTRALKSALRDYHEYRKQLVPCIVELLDERTDDLR